MICTKLQLKNYKVFDDVTFSLTSRNNSPKNLAIIYGANGSGKSTILEAFVTLYDLMNTKDITNTLDAIKDRLSSNNNSDIDYDDLTEISKYLSRGSISISKIYNKIKGVTEDLPTSLILYFEENGYKGSYEIRLYDNSIIYEELKYLISKNMGCYYKIEKNKNYINDKLILDKNIKNRFNELINQSFGIHSFMSIIKNELQNFNNDYINNAFLENFINLLKNFDKFSYRICNLSNTIEGISKTNSYLLSHISSGNINKTTKTELSKTEKALTNLLKFYINDLIKIEYIVTEESYNLLITKNINNKNVKIFYSEESSGIKEIINLMPYFIKALNGEIVILDEYANHIHDSLSLYFLNSIIPLIKGQLILSTHSTVLLSQMYENHYDSFYYIKVKNSTRSIECITDIETRIRSKYNYQKKYLQDELYYYYRNNIDENIDPIIFEKAIDKLR